MKIDNVHVPLFALGTGTRGTRLSAAVADASNDAPFSRFGELNALPPNTAPYEATNGGLTNFRFNIQWAIRCLHGNIGSGGRCGSAQPVNAGSTAHTTSPQGRRAGSASNPRYRRSLAWVSGNGSQRIRTTVTSRQFRSLASGAQTERSIGGEKPESPAFSLVELTLALGIAAFCLLAVSV